VNGPAIIEDPEAYVAEMADAYIEAAIWSDISTDDEDAEMGCDNPSEYADLLDAGSRAAVVAYVAAFAVANRDDLAAIAEMNGDRAEWTDASLAGHDLYLTGAGHGAGFWDRGYGDAGDRLSEACKYQSESAHPYVGDDGRVYIDGLTAVSA